MDTPDKKEYEISFLTTAEEGSAAVTKLIREKGGTLTLEGGLKKIALAYKIKKETEAFFGVYRFEMDGTGVKELEKDLLVTPLILRSIIIVPPKIKPQAPRRDPSAPRTAPAAPEKKAGTEVLSNEALEKKIEEILQ